MREKIIRQMNGWIDGYMNSRKLLMNRKIN